MIGEGKNFMGWMEEKRCNLNEMAVSCYRSGAIKIFFASFDLTVAKKIVPSIARFYIMALNI